MHYTENPGNTGKGNLAKKRKVMKQNGCLIITR